jgi:uncharacterized protein YjbJ (UPF0337 family)
MDDDRTKGMGKQISGSLKEAIGKITGDAETQAEGTSEKVAGKAQKVVGSAKASARDMAKD